jgi:hypothetical protein
MTAFYIQDIIDAICANSLPEDEVRWEKREKELRWSWTNVRTEQVWFAQLSKVRKSGLDPTDRADMTRLDFLYGKMTAFEVVNRIERLNRLKAFW